MKAILLTGGVGDIFAIESLMTDEERQSIDCIFYATRATKLCMELFSELPTFPRLKRQALLWKNFTSVFGFNSKEQLVDKLCAYQPEDLQKTVKKLTSEVEDWSIAKIFPENREYTYSSFIKFNLSCIKKFNLPKNYYCICPSSSNDKRDNNKSYHVSNFFTRNTQIAEYCDHLVAFTVKGIKANGTMDTFGKAKKLGKKVILHEAVK